MLTDAFLALDRWLNRWVVRLGIALLAIAASLAFYQVLARFVLESPSDWSEVATRTAIIWMVYLGIGSTLREGAMLSVRLLSDALQGKAAHAWLDGLIAASIVTFLALAGWYGGQVAWAVRFQLLAGLEIPISWAYLAIPVGCLLGIIATLAQVLDNARQRRGARSDQTHPQPSP